MVGKGCCLKICWTDQRVEVCYNIHVYGGEEFTTPSHICYLSESLKMLSNIGKTGTIGAQLTSKVIKMFLEIK